MSETLPIGAEAPARSREPALPSWAQAAFPDGLERHGGDVWAQRSFVWSLAEQARMTVGVGAPRAGDDAAIGFHFEHLIRAATATPGLDLPRAPLILDLGSQDGATSVMPWLRVLPQARVVATDPAGVLLAALVNRAQGAGVADRILCVVAHPQAPIVAPGSVDLVTGVGCLHKAPDPDALIAAAARALRPGGHAVFLEPFDGYGLLRLAYERICAEADLRGDPLIPAVRAALERIVVDIAARTLPDPTDPVFGRLEDKWLFGRAALEEASRGFGFRDVRFFAHNDHETLYRDVALVQIRAETAAASASLPDWALAVLDSFDRALRPPVKRLLMLEGTMILTR